MTNTMGGAHLCTSQSSIFQQMMGSQSPQPPQQVEPWMQTLQMPCPTISIPWSVPSSQQPELITFTGRPNYKPVFHHKRKLETPEFGDACHQAKQLITEEKMAAHFKGLHISSNHESENPVPSTSTGHTLSFPRKQADMDLDVDATITAKQTDELSPRLVISEELKRMQQEPILPSTILSKLERPSMALVLWEPPKPFLRILPSRDIPTPIPSTSLDNNSNNNNNNNNDTIPDLNNVSPSAPSVFEPMEW